MANTPAAVIQQLNNTVNQWLGYLENYTIGQLHMQPGAGSWSIGQVYTHIISETEYFIGQAKKCLAHNNDYDKQMHANAAAMFKANSFPAILIEGPATGKYIAQPVSKEAVIKELQLLQHEANEVYNKLIESNAAGKTQHPGLLFFNAIEWLQFADMHMRHHIRQKERIDAVLFNL